MSFSALCRLGSRRRRAEAVLLSGTQFVARRSPQPRRKLRKITKVRLEEWKTHFLKVRTQQDSEWRVRLLTFNGDVDGERAGSHEVLSFGHIRSAARSAERLGRVDHFALVVPLNGGCGVPVRFTGHHVQVEDVLQATECFWTSPEDWTIWFIVKHIGMKTDVCVEYVHDKQRVRNSQWTTAGASPITGGFLGPLGPRSSSASHLKSPPSYPALAVTLTMEETLPGAVSVTLNVCVSMTSNLENHFTLRFCTGATLMMSQVSW